MNTNYDVINAKKYFNLLQSPELNEQEQKNIQDFEEFMAKSERYRDYLVGPLKDNKDTYENGINQLAVLETMNPDSHLTTYQKMAIAAYEKQKTNELQIKENKIRKLEKNSDVSYGYTNSFSLILSVLATGILIGVVLFMIK